MINKESKNERLTDEEGEREKEKEREQAVYMR